MANTTNLNMVKPAGTDHALISVINSNMDIIDGAVGALPSGSTLQGEIESANEAIENLENYSRTVITTNVNIFTSGVEVYKFGDKLKYVKCGIQVAQALTAGTRYTICTNTNLKSLINFYKEMCIGRDSGVTKALFGYVNIDANGNFYLTPIQNVAVNDYLWVQEAYI